MRCVRGVAPVAGLRVGRQDEDCGCTGTACASGRCLDHRHRWQSRSQRMSRVDGMCAAIAMRWCWLCQGRCCPGAGTQRRPSHKPWPFRSKATEPRRNPTADESLQDRGHDRCRGLGDALPLVRCGEARTSVFRGTRVSRRVHPAPGSRARGHSHWQPSTAARGRIADRARICRRRAGHVRGLSSRRGNSEGDAEGNISPPFMIPPAEKPVQASVVERRMDRRKEE
jgi:hypothetical protein